MLVLALLLAGPGGSMAQQDAAGCEDHPLLTRMSGFYIEDCDFREFDQYEFYDAEGYEFLVEGRKTGISYEIQEGARPPSELEVLRNYSNAIEATGGQIVSRDDYNVYLELVRGDARAWIHVHCFSGGESYDLTVVEEKAMTQQVMASAATMVADIQRTGKVAVYGILFDTDQALIKPESEPTLQEIAQLLEENTDLELFVVGHTDATGSFDHNMELSRDRAAAVVEALVSRYGIDRSRLEPHGIGPLAPVASNASEDGRGKNRRVELVAR
jgi:outer membrane protein OmpA-like peptidoglycan-associated protein